MLNVHFGDMPDAIYNTSVYFDNTYLDAWITEDFSMRMIKSIDRAKVLGPNAIDSHILGVISPTRLSGGLKTLLLIDHLPKTVFNASNCGDNCAKWILEIAKRHQEDITINLHHIMDFETGRKQKKPFELRIKNTGQVVHSMDELIVPAGLLLQEGEI